MLGISRLLKSKRPAGRFLFPADRYCHSFVIAWYMLAGYLLVTLNVIKGTFSYQQGQVSHVLYVTFGRKKNAGFLAGI